MKQCQICRSITTDGRKEVEGDVIACCRECASDEETTFTHEGVYVVAINPRWGSNGHEKQYAWPLNRK